MSPSSVLGNTQATAKQSKKPKPDLATLPVVAWIGSDYEGKSEVVWAKTRGQARTAAAAGLECDFKEVVSLRRYPELDDFTGNLRRYLLEHGWYFECQQCSRQCYGAAPDEPTPTVLDEHDNVFCSVEHQQQYETYWGMHRAIDAAILEDFRKLHPEVEVPHPSVSVGHNEWYGWVQAGPPLNKHVTVWEMVSVHQQHLYVRSLDAHWVKDPS